MWPPGNCHGYHNTSISGLIFNWDKKMLHGSQGSLAWETRQAGNGICPSAPVNCYVLAHVLLKLTRLLSSKWAFLHII